MRDAEFNDARLVQVYDAQCPWSSADALFLSLANQTPRVRVADLGCGTGRFTLALAAAGHIVTGIDPARASLDRAQTRSGADRVTWIEGKADALPTGAFDLAMMTGHVAQFLTDDAEWASALADLNRALVPGGRLILDSRDPRARRWETWNPLESHEQFTLPDGTSVACWTEVTEVMGELVSFVQHYTFSDQTNELLSHSTLHFRPERTLRRTLDAAGFEIEQIYGGGHREPSGKGDGEFVVIARAKEQKIPAEAGTL